MNNKETAFFDKPENVQKMLRVFYAICALLVILDCTAMCITLGKIYRLFTRYTVLSAVWCWLSSPNGCERF